MFKNDTATAIFAIDADRRTPKYLQIVHSVTKAIKQGRYKKGDRIVSINQLSNECFLSRDTVQKAYDLLERDRIIEAVKGKGFYINRTDIVVPHRVLLIFNRLSKNKKIIYDSFINTLANKGKVDIAIHHGNGDLLKELIELNTGQYDYFVVIPHFSSHIEDATTALGSLPPGQLILLDKDMPELPNVVAAVFQQFEEDIMTALKSELSSLLRYNKLVFIQSAAIPHSSDIAQGFSKFCGQYGFAHAIKTGMRSDEILQPKTAYIVLKENDLVNLIKSCQQNLLEVGKDIGIVSYNETPLKEILMGGISVMTTQHAEMGRTAARLILENRKEKIHNPFTFIARKSL